MRLPLPVNTCTCAVTPFPHLLSAGKPMFPQPFNNANIDSRRDVCIVSDRMLNQTSCLNSSDTDCLTKSERALSAAMISAISFFFVSWRVICVRDLNGFVLVVFFFVVVVVVVYLFLVFFFIFFKILKLFFNT